MAADGDGPNGQVLLAYAFGKKVSRKRVGKLGSTVDSNQPGRSGGLAMRLFDKARLRLRSLFRRQAVELELEAELIFHLDQLIEENIASGMSPEKARSAAKRKIGVIELYKE